MMRKVGIITDSTACIPEELVVKYNIGVMPIQIIFEGKSYLDGIDISPGEVYRIMRQQENLPTTSTPSAGEFLDAYRRMSEQVESVLCITLTSLQSKIYDTALVAKEMAEETLTNTAIEVLDSRSVGGALGLIVLEAARAASQGADMAQVTEVARGMMPRVHFIAMLDTLFYLARTGRTGRAAAWAGSLLKIKPILEHTTSTGVTMPVARPRTKTKAVKQLMEIMAERVGDSPVHVIAHHADELEDGEKLKAEIASRFNCVELYLTEFTPGMGVHCGPGVLAITFYTEE
jgi:DegV family protein with EDD domain